MTETHASLFEKYRYLLFSIAYRMLSSAMEAEDMVQETYLRFQAVPLESIQQPKAFLTTTLTRLCLDALKSARIRREEYIGPWLPEPIPTRFGGDSEAVISQQESVTMAFLVLLERLSPLERAVFLLRDIFAYDYGEIAAMVGRSEANCRQSYHRAKAAIAAARPRFHPTPEHQQRLLERFMGAMAGGDLQALTDLLAEDVTLWSDGGGHVAAATLPISGAEKVARFFLGLMRRVTPEMDVRVEVREINGLLGLLWYLNGRLDTAISLTWEGDNTANAGEKIAAVRILRNPEKLRALGQAPSE